MIEAVVEQHRILLLGLSENGIITFEGGAAKILNKKQEALVQRIKDVYGVAGRAFDQPIEVSCEPIEDAKGIRNRLTHPKSFQDCGVDILDFDKVREAEKWFEELNNSFVAAAREHQKTRDWNVES
ncbi:MAG TPA: hypothetical protein VK604_09975 [Bryobacteraceae bacterium]|nr:hypothetical protein [Bryobacteraceae bacterium]